MLKLDRKTKYEIIKRIINNVDSDKLYNYVTDSYGKDDLNNIEERREELVDYLNEVSSFWNEHNIDLTSRQYLEKESFEKPKNKVKKLGE